MTKSFDNSLNACKITKTDTGFYLVANAKTDFICKYNEYIKDEASFFSSNKRAILRSKQKLKQEEISPTMRFS